MATTAREKDGPPPHEAKPFVLSAQSQNGQRLAATNAAAEKIGLYPGMALTDARALYPALAVEHADPKGDAEALKKLALWSQCYSPFTRDEPPDGVLLDVTGCAHLFGGESALLETFQQRLQSFGLTARLAIAPTIGAALAASRHGLDERIIVSGEKISSRLRAFPVSALRIEEKTVRALERVGLKRIGDLLGKPRAPLAARFGPELVRRLDQALGKEDETFRALTPTPFYRAGQRFAEPIITLASMEVVVERLTHDLSNKLEKAGKGARRLELCFYRVDGCFEALEVRTSAVTREAKHLARLLTERLDQVKDNAGFGFEAATLSAFDAEDIAAYQDGLLAGGAFPEKTADPAPLLDRLVNRFGARNVMRLAPRESHLPERAAQTVSVLRKTPSDDWRRHLKVINNGAAFPRPLLLFQTPEPVTAISLAPDSPPMRFEWRRQAHLITRADGPERIAPEWWRTNTGESKKTRDYYRLEDEQGRRFWLYRDGLYEREGDEPRWFIHGLFP